MSIILAIAVFVAVAYWLDSFNDSKVDLGPFVFIENEEIYRKECEASGEQWVRPEFRAKGRPNAGWGK